MLPHALILATPPGVDPIQAASQLPGPGDTTITLTPHKKPTGATVGIFVDDIRQLQLDTRTARPGTRTLVLIANAARLTEQAQNALLKLLEEPRPGLHLVLATPQPQQLLATVRSRCWQQSYQPSATPHASASARAATTAHRALPTERQARIAVMAANPAQAQRLATDDIYYNQHVALFRQAKQLVSGASYQRLLAAHALGDDRTQALDVIDAALRLLLHQLTRHYQPPLHGQLDRLYQARQAIAQNGHVRLQLLASMV